MMDDKRKPFMSIAADVDDGALEAIARKKGVPAMTPPARLAQAGTVGQGTASGDRTHEPTPQLFASDPAERKPTPRRRMSYVKACLPDYALAELKVRALKDRVSVNHLLLKALTLSGIAIRSEDMIEDGRRLRGKNALTFD
jgi:hypothetical protein